MGLRENARKEIEEPEPEDAKEVQILVDFDARLAEMEDKLREREAELADELAQARKICEAKTAQIVKQEREISALEEKLKGYEGRLAKADTDLLKTVKDLEARLPDGGGGVQSPREGGGPRAA